MIRELRYLLLGILIAISGAAKAQSIYGRIVDEKKQPVISASVRAIQGGITKGGAATDFDGNYEIKPLEPGYYLVEVIALGLDTQKIKDVVVSPNDETKLNFTMSVRAIEYKTKGKEVEVKSWKKPLVGSQNTTLTSAEIAHLPTTQVADAAATAPGAYQQKRGAELNMGGGRVEGTLYIIDGVQVQYIAGNRSGVDMSQGSVDQIEVISSGIEAKYGDVSGGVVNITTRGPSAKITGDIRVEHSLDGYKNNLASFSIAGPVLKMATKGDTNHTKRPVMGFALSGDYYDDHNRYPTYNQDYVMKADALNTILQHPLRMTTDNSGQPKFFYASDYVTPDQLRQVAIPPNNELREFRLNGKLDYQPNSQLHFVAGCNIDYVSKDLYSRNAALFAPQAIPTQNNFSGRGFIRMTQKFGKSNDTTHGIITNAYYSIQADFQRESTEVIDKKFGKDYFKYAYIGKFNETKQNLYFPAQKDSASGRTGVVFFGSQSTGISFTPSNLNPNLANYTTDLFNYLKGTSVPINTIQTVQSMNGLANGNEPAATYSIGGFGLYTSPGTTQSYYSIFKSDQYGLTVDASLDLKTGKLKHAIQFGLYYQQRIVSNFVVSPTGLWGQMRNGLANTIDNGGLYLDKTNPIFIVNGKKYSLTDINKGVVIPNATDTIIYNYANKGNSTFDRNLRKKLNLSNSADINIDTLNPSMLSLDMFSADQLLNSGHSYVSYYGYSYTGAPQTGTINFNDFWTAKDANGDHTRPIGSFTPNYIGGYIQDKFRYENIKFNVGVRIDRYSANTKVLIDPYSEYPEKTVNQVEGSKNLLNSGAHPSNMGSNYVVYIDDNNSTSPSVIGYRNGNNWYDPNGNFIEDPNVLKKYSGGRDPQPYIQDAVKNVKITDTNFNPNLSFTDYVPQVTVMPRIQLSFPISEEADFFAHYDIYTQRPYPNSVAISTPATFYYLQANNTSVVPNSNLKNSKTFDYEVGFQQKLTSNSAITLKGFYKERKDMVTVVPYLYAWPTTYYTYGNRDFSTTKGATFNYDFRAKNHLQINFSYTLQFAEGTGSTPYSTTSGTGSTQGGILQSFIQAGLPNIRYVMPLDYDSRHNFVVNVDYRFKEGEGPMIGKSYIFENAGVDFIGRARSGEPFTPYSLPDNVGHTVIGGINNSRLPWHYGVDMRIDKDIRVSYGKKNAAKAEGVRPKAMHYVKAYMFIQNLFNIRDITGVYGYTGKPGDDGYLASSFGQRYAPQQVNPASFAALYNIYINDPGHYNYARTINFGLEFHF